MPGVTRNCVGAESPLTGGYAKSEVGGFFPMALKGAAGRGGTGAVIGSKNLKMMNRGCYDNPLFARYLHDVGTGSEAGMVGGNQIGNLPSYNFDVNFFGRRTGRARLTPP